MTVSKKYLISKSTVRRANESLMKLGVTDAHRINYDGNIILKYHVKNGIALISFTNQDIKRAYTKARDRYAERI